MLYERSRNVCESNSEEPCDQVLRGYPSIEFHDATNLKQTMAVCSECDTREWLND